MNKEITSQKKSRDINNRITEWFDNNIMLEGNRKYISIPALLLDNFEELKIDMKLFTYICLITSNQKSYYMKREEVAKKLKTTERTVTNWNKDLAELGYLETTVTKNQDKETGRFSTVKVKYNLSGLETKLTSLLNIKPIEKNEPVPGNIKPAQEKLESSRKKETLKLSDSSSLTERTSEINSERNYTKSGYPTDIKKKVKVYSEDTINLVNNFHQELGKNDLVVSTDYKDYDFQYVEDNPQFKEHIPFLVNYILSVSDLPSSYQNNISYLFNKNRVGRVVRFCEDEAILEAEEHSEIMFIKFETETISPAMEQETSIQTTLQGNTYPEGEDFKDTLGSNSISGIHNKHHSFDEPDMDAINAILDDFM